MISIVCVKIKWRQVKYHQSCKGSITASKKKYEIMNILCVGRYNTYYLKLLILSISALSLVASISSIFNFVNFFSIFSSVHKFNF